MDENAVAIIMILIAFVAPLVIIVGDNRNFNPKK